MRRRAAADGIGFVMLIVYALSARAEEATHGPAYQPPYCADCPPGPEGAEAPAPVAPQSGLEAPPAALPPSFQPMPEAAPLPAVRPSRAMPPPGYPAACPWPLPRGTVCTPDGLRAR
jgi:hypothetical protein